MIEIKNTKEKYIEKLLNEAKMNFKPLKLGRHTLFLVDFNPGKSFPIKENIEILLFLIKETKTLVVACPNIYKLKKGDSQLSILVALNNTNSRLMNGTVTLEDDFVTYICYKEFGDIKSITKENILRIIDEIIAAIIFTNEEIGRLKTSESS